jgi:hypothetical protein
MAFVNQAQRSYGKRKLQSDWAEGPDSRVDSHGLTPGVLCRLMSPVGIQRASASRGGGSNGFAGGGGDVSPCDRMTEG